MIGGMGCGLHGCLRVEMAGRVVEWLWVTTAGTASPGVAESFVKVSYLEDKTCPPVTAAALHILQQHAFLPCVQASNMLSPPNNWKHRWRLNNLSLNTGLQFLISSAVSFDLGIQFVVVNTIHACYLRLTVCPGVLLWTV